jgi:hypothetical protein
MNTPGQNPGLPPGGPREAVIKALAERYPDPPSKFDPPTDWSAKRDREDDEDEDDDDCDDIDRYATADVWFRHTLPDGVAVNTQLVQMETSQWERWEGRHEPGWAISRQRDVIRAIKIMTHDGYAVPMPPPQPLKLEKSTESTSDDSPSTHHTVYWSSRKAGSQTRLEWVIMSPSEWLKDPRSSDSCWFSKKISPRKILALQLLA